MSIVGRIEYPQDNGSERYDENSRDETSDVNIATGNHFLTALVTLSEQEKRRQGIVPDSSFFLTLVGKASQLGLIIK